MKTIWTGIQIAFSALGGSSAGSWVVWTAFCMR